MIPPRHTRGLTLIELVAAMAIFALVAVMGAQALSAMLRQRDGLLDRSGRVEEISVAISLIRADLNAAVPMLFFPPERAAPQSAATQTQDGFAISVGGQSELDLTASPRMHRVSYRLDRHTRQLWRTVWPTLIPAYRNARSPEVLLLEGISDMQIRSHWGQAGWKPGLNGIGDLEFTSGGGDTDGSGTVPQLYSSSLPRAIEITLHLDGIGAVPLLETLQ